MTKIKYYNGDLFVLDKNKWENLTTKIQNEKFQAFYLKAAIENDFKSTHMSFSQRDVNMQYTRLMMNTVYNNSVDKKDINTDKIIFMNSELDLKTGIANTITEPDFTPYQIEHDLITNPNVIPEDKRKLVDRFFREVSNNELEMETSLLEVIGSSMAPRNDSIMPIFYSAHRSSGKGTMAEIISAINGRTRQVKGDQWWGDGESRFALSSAHGQLAVWIDEVPLVLPSSSTEKIKSHIDSKRYLEIERKGKDQEEILNTPLFFATSNNKSKFYNPDDSIKGRIIWYDFKMNQIGDAKFTSQDIETITKDEDCIKYIIYRAVNAYKEVLKRTGNRNERFTLPKSNKMFWKSVSDANKGMEIIEHSQAIKDRWNAQEEFLPNDELRTALNSYLLENKNDKITLAGLQTDVIGYIHANKLGEAELTKQTFNKEQVRGIKIKWFKDEDLKDPFVTAPWGDKVRRSWLEKYEEDQLKTADNAEKQMKESY